MGDSREDYLGLYLRGRMKRWLFAGALAFATVGQGLASDLPPPAAPVPPRAPAAYIPPVSPVYNWGGLYFFGLDLGYGFGTSSWSDPTDPGGTTGNFNLRGFLTGATIGANFQTDAFVFGAEADFAGSFIDGKVSSPFCSTGTQCETKNFWFSTPRGRLGYAADRVLFYGTRLAVHLVTLHWGRAARSSVLPKAAGPPAPALKPLSAKT